jgi:hypothetical protein
MIPGALEPRAGRPTASPPNAGEPVTPHPRPAADDREFVEYEREGGGAPSERTTGRPRSVLSKLWRSVFHPTDVPVTSRRSHGEPMLKEMTRARVIQTWFVVVALMVLAAIVLGVSVTIGTATMLVALCLVPPAIVLILWPAVQPQTVAEVLRDVDKRG